MMIAAYPCNYSGDMSALPLLKSKSGAALLRIEFGEYLTPDLVSLMTKATRKGAQWLELNPPVIESYLKFVEVSDV